MMDQEQKTAIYQQNDGPFVSLLQEVTAIKEKYIVREIKWYRADARTVRRYFLFSSVLIIFLSVSIPFLTTLEGSWRTILLPIAALMVAGLTGLSAFLRLDDHWRGSIHARLTLEHMLWVWELKIAEAKYETDVKKGMELLVKATEKLLEDTQDTIANTAEEHFKQLQPPYRNKKE
jgi:Protein of unknown function (DUF4231)